MGMNIKNLMNFKLLNIFLIIMILLKFINISILKKFEKRVLGISMSFWFYKRSDAKILKLVSEIDGNGIQNIHKKK